MQECIADVCVWMNNSALRLTVGKTEFIIFKPIIRDASNFKFQVGTSLVHSSNQIKILGVTLDSKMTLDPQISTTCRLTYMQIRKINSIRKFLTINAVKTLDPSTINCDCLPRLLHFSVSWVVNEIDKETSTSS